MVTRFKFILLALGVVVGLVGGLWLTPSEPGSGETDAHHGGEHRADQTSVVTT